MMQFIFSISGTPVIFGLPLMIILGILTLLSLFTTAAIGFLSFHNIKIVPFKFHIFFAVTTIILALTHGLMGLSRFFL